MQFKMVAGFFSPVTPMYDSPYQPMLEIYQKRKQENPEGADEWFLDEYGEEYFALTQAFTKINDGVLPTVQAAEARDKYQNLIEAYPELGSLIVGEEGGGEAVKFSNAVYSKQFRPGSPLNQRTPYSGEEIVSLSEARLGWIKYTRAMDIVEAMQFERGLPNLQVKDAADLANMKRMMTIGVATKYPDWFKEFSERDDAKWSKRINGMKEIVTDDRLMNRPDIAQLHRYLKIRDGVVAALQTREQHGIDAAANSDLKMLYETAVGEMKKTNLAFSDLYNRWLANDPLLPV
jgi:hypothetical protein